jgi:flagellar biogenesis protein FliO
MKRQFSSWTSGLTRRSQGVPGGRAGPWASFPSGRRGKGSLWSSGWFWTAIIVGILLIFSLVTLSAIGPTAVPAVNPDAGVRISDPEATVPEYDPTQTTRPDTPLVPLLIDMVWKLGLVAGLIILTAWVLRYMRSRFGLFDEPGPSGGTFAVLDTVTIGPDQTIHTVDLGRRVLVVGATGASLTNLADIDDPDEILYLRRRSGVGASEFEDILENSAASDQPPPIPDPSPSPSPSPAPDIALDPIPDPVPAYKPDPEPDTAPPPFQDVAQRLRLLAETPPGPIAAEEAGEPDNS